MFRVTRYPMIYKTESGWVGYRKKYRVAGRVRVPAGHCQQMVKQIYDEKEDDEDDPWLVIKFRDSRSCLLIVTLLDHGNITKWSRKTEAVLEHLSTWAFLSINLNLNTWALEHLPVCELLFSITMPGGEHLSNWAFLSINLNLNTWSLEQLSLLCPFHL